MLLFRNVEVRSHSVRKNLRILQKTAFGCRGAAAIQPAAQGKTRWRWLHSGRQANLRADWVHVMTEPNWAQLTSAGQTLLGRTATPGKAAIVETLSCLPFQKIQQSTAVQDHRPTLIAASSVWSWASLKPMKTWGSTRCSCQGCLGLHQWHIQACITSADLPASHSGCFLLSPLPRYPSPCSRYHIQTSRATWEQAQCPAASWVLCKYWDARLVKSNRRSLCYTSACFGKA